MAKKILCADDEIDFLENLQYRLAKMGYEVITAQDGQEALHLIKDQKPDLVMLDIVMPHLHGDKLCAMIKADPNLNHIPVIVMSASTDSFSHLDLTSIGASDRLIKPFSADELMMKIKNLIG